MARPTKRGLDYFPMDCHMDKNIKAVIRKFNIEGLGVLVGLYQHIYSEGYWIEWNEETAEDFALEFGIDEDLLNSILCFLVKRNVFNKELFDKEKVLSSKGIQKRFLEATKRRADNNNLTAYELLHTETTQASELMHTETPLNGVNVCKSTQSKVKKSKVKKNKELTPQNKFDPKKYVDNIDWIDNDLWIEWIEHKKKLKLSVTERALKANVKKLQGFGKDKSEFNIIKALEKNWKDFYVENDLFSSPVKKQQTPTKTYGRSHGTNIHE